MSFISTNNLLKGGVFFALFFSAWFHPNSLKTNVRANILSTLFASICALAFNKILTLIFPFKFRPCLYNEFVIPYGIDISSLSNLSSFPSDHAALFYALATGVFFISKKLGLFALLYTTIFICLPRVYLGFHFPSDIIIGGLMGVLLCLFFNHPVLLRKVSLPVLNWSTYKPQIFYPAFFIISFLFVEMFQSLRTLFSFVYSLIF